MALEIGWEVKGDVAVDFVVVVFLVVVVVVVVVAVVSKGKLMAWVDDAENSAGFDESGFEVDVDPEKEIMILS